MATTTEQMTTSTDNIAVKLSRLRTTYDDGVTQSLAFRQTQLKNLLRFLNEAEGELIAALRADLGKSAAEALYTEIRFVAAEINYALKHLAGWMKRKKVPTALIAQPGKSYIYPQPLGVVLIIGTWNYPVQIVLAPLVGALAAGNCVVIKPSEVAPAVSHLLARELRHYIDHRCLEVIEGGISETTVLLNERFDHIFYTGSQEVGKLVMTAAAKHLTPVTLELGGKSPCIVDASANLEVAAKRIVWGKFTNSGQTCVAPDYVLVEESVEEALLAKMRDAVREFYGNNPQQSPDYCRVINKRHLQRLLDLLPGSGDIVIGGTSDESDCYLAPTILRNVPLDSRVMENEIFGPILPVIKVKNLNEAVHFIRSKPHPLALYLFTSYASHREYVIQHTTSGSVCVNYTIMQLAVPALPFGGVGESGMGAYHGKKSFDTFTHYKSVLMRPTWFDHSILYPPYKSSFIKLIRWFM